MRRTIDLLGNLMVATACGGCGSGASNATTTGTAGSPGMGCAAIPTVVDDARTACDGAAP